MASHSGPFFPDNKIELSVNRLKFVAPISAHDTVSEPQPHRAILTSDAEASCLSRTPCPIRKRVIWELLA